MDFLSDKAEVNMKHITSIRVLCGRKYVTLWMDERTKQFQLVKPFAYDDGNYYVICPCCHQIERVADHYFKDVPKATILCRTRNITEKTFFRSGKPISAKLKGYEVDLTDWKDDGK